MQYQIPHAGMSRTGDQIRSTIKTLQDSLPEARVYTSLQAAQDPLAILADPPRDSWWWAFADEEEKQHGLPPMLEQYQDRERPPKTKCLVIAGLRRMIDGDDGEQAAPDTDDQAYKPPPPGGQKRKSQVFETNPDKIDRGTTAHKETEKALAGALRKAGLQPRSPKQELGDPKFDIAWRDDVNGVGVAYIGEVKSLTEENETWQIRLAIGQVLDYVHTLDATQGGLAATALEGCPRRTRSGGGGAPAPQARPLEGPVRHTRHHPHLAREVRRHARRHTLTLLALIFRRHASQPR